MMDQNLEEDAPPSVTYGDQDENGVDLASIRENLRLTPTERLERNRKFNLFADELRRAARAAGLRKDG
jgi:hypothetical protein